ncbi:PREDICTED: uncharacterized protein LOC106810805 [Priapulus caudatus]|uniref:Uncharacterized protein LOC106810805 n=1 Tax=Priapulus caudatus TaxID=37621 RepID=A0ABM1EC24_PRICU|nr:PREDICTED: uncharacterized protein LOC106810805 [Priapulus caudatus]
MTDLFDKKPEFWTSSNEKLLTPTVAKICTQPASEAKSTVTDGELSRNAETSRDTGTEATMSSTTEVALQNSLDGDDATVPTDSVEVRESIPCLEDRQSGDGGVASERSDSRTPTSDAAERQAEPLRKSSRLEAKAAEKKQGGDASLQETASPSNDVNADSSKQVIAPGEVSTARVRRSSKEDRSNSSTSVDVSSWMKPVGKVISQVTAGSRDRPCVNGTACASSSGNLLQVNLDSNDITTDIISILDRHESVGKNGSAHSVDAHTAVPSPVKAEKPEPLLFSELTHTATKECASAVAGQCSDQVIAKCENPPQVSPCFTKTHAVRTDLLQAEIDSKTDSKTGLIPSGQGLQRHTGEAVTTISTDGGVCVRNTGLLQISSDLPSQDTLPKRSPRVMNLEKMRMCAKTASSAAASDAAHDKTHKPACDVSVNLVDKKGSAANSEGNLCCRGDLQGAEVSMAVTVSTAAVTTVGADKPVTKREQCDIPSTADEHGLDAAGFVKVRGDISKKRPATLLSGGNAISITACAENAAERSTVSEKPAVSSSAVQKTGRADAHPASLPSQTSIAQVTSANSKRVVKPSYKVAIGLEQREKTSPKSVQSQSLSELSFLTARRSSCPPCSSPEGSASPADSPVKKLLPLSIDLGPQAHLNRKSKLRANYSVKGPKSPPREKASKASGEQDSSGLSSVERQVERGWTLEAIDSPRSSSPAEAIKRKFSREAESRDATAPKSVPNTLTTGACKPISVTLHADAQDRFVGNKNQADEAEKSANHKPIDGSPNSKVTTKGLVQAERSAVLESPSPSSASSQSEQTRPKCRTKTIDVSDKFRGASAATVLPSRGRRVAVAAIRSKRIARKAAGARPGARRRMLDQLDCEYLSRLKQGGAIAPRRARIKTLGMSYNETDIIKKKFSSSAEKTAKSRASAAGTKVGAKVVSSPPMPPRLNKKLNVLMGCFVTTAGAHGGSCDDARGRGENSASLAESPQKLLILNASEKAAKTILNKYKKGRAGEISLTAPNANEEPAKKKKKLAKDADAQREKPPTLQLAGSAKRINLPGSAVGSNVGKTTGTAGNFEGRGGSSPLKTYGKPRSPAKPQLLFVNYKKDGSTECSYATKEVTLAGKEICMSMPTNVKPVLSENTSAGIISTQKQPATTVLAAAKPSSSSYVGAAAEGSLADDAPPESATVLHREWKPIMVPKNGKITAKFAKGVKGEKMGSALVVLNSVCMRVDDRRLSTRQHEGAYKFKEIVVKKCDGYTHVTLSTSTLLRNAISPQVFEESPSHLTEQRAPRQQQSVLISSSMNVFCSD